MSNSVEPKITDRELHFMDQALSLAKRGYGRTSPNPMVGAVVARGEEVLGRGYHLYSSVTHAEVAALREAGAQARGADLFVTLEPCSHVGRTPPCAESIVRSGLARVFVGTIDPNPQVSGRGLSFIRGHGIPVAVGLREAECRLLNESFFHFVQHGYPWVVLKLALTLDGRIATHRGESKWITGEEARDRVQQLRFGADAILVGIGTVLADDPSLTVRGEQDKPITKVILDGRLRCPDDARLFDGQRVFIVHGPNPPVERVHRLAEKAQLIQMSSRDPEEFWTATLGRLGSEGVTSLLIEGGGRVAADVLQAGMVRRLCFFYAPKILGSSGISGVGKMGIDSLHEAPEFEIVEWEKVGSDLFVDLRVRGDE